MRSARIPLRSLCLALCLSLLLTVLPLITTPALAASTWYVDGALGTDDTSHGTGPGTAAFRTIQYAINDTRVLDGDTIEVAAGTYNEQVTVSKALNLRGARAGVDGRGRVGTETVVDATPGSTAIHVLNTVVGTVIIDGFSFKGKRATVYIECDTSRFLNNIVYSNGTEAGAPAALVYIDGAAGLTRDVTVQYNDITPSSPALLPSGCNALRINAHGLANALIDSNRLHNGSNVAGALGAGLALYATNVNALLTVTNNEMYNNGSDGMFTYNSTFATLSVKNNDIRNNGQCGIKIAPNVQGSVDIARNGIHNNGSQGVRIESLSTSLSAAVTCSQIYSNTGGGVTNLNPGITIDADSNWWGCAAGPGSAGCDSVSGPVDYTPWNQGTIGNGVSVNTFTGTGIATLTPSDGAMQNLVAVDVPADPNGKPNLVFGHGFFSLNNCCMSGASSTITIALPQAVPVGTQYWKYGPTPSDPSNHWYQIPIGDNDGDNVITITLVDGGIGDDDLTANSVIVDQGGPGWPTGGGGAISGVPVFPSVYIGIGAAFGAGLLAYFVRRRLIRAG